MNFDKLVQSILTEEHIPADLSEERQMYCCNVSITEHLPYEFYHMYESNADDSWSFNDWDSDFEDAECWVMLTTENAEQAITRFIELIWEKTGGIYTSEELEGDISEEQADQIQAKISKKIKEIGEVVHTRIGHVKGTWKVIDETSTSNSVSICVMHDPVAVHKDKIRAQFKDDDVFGDAIDFF